MKNILVRSFATACPHAQTMCGLQTRRNHDCVFVQGTNAKIHRRFDLKGSTHGRNASDAEKRKGSAATLKCNDFRERRLKTGRKIRMGENKESILKALKDGESGMSLCKCSVSSQYG